MRRGEEDGGLTVVRDVLQRRGTGVATENAGELRLLVVTLHETKREGVTEVRNKEGKPMDVVSGAGAHCSRRNQRNTATEAATPVRNWSGLGAQEGEET